MRQTSLRKLAASFLLLGVICTFSFFLASEPGYAADATSTPGELASLAYKAAMKLIHRGDLEAGKEALAVIETTYPHTGAGRRSIYTLGALAAYEGDMEESLDKFLAYEEQRIIDQGKYVPTEGSALAAMQARALANAAKAAATAASEGKSPNAPNTQLNLANATLQQIIDTYPNSRFAINARKCVAKNNKTIVKNDAKDARTEQRFAEKNEKVAAKIEKKAGKQTENDQKKAEKDAKKAAKRAGKKPPPAE